MTTESKNRTLSDIVAEAASIARAIDALRIRAMQYQAENKELLALDLGFAFDIFYDLPYSQWRDLSKWGNQNEI